MASMFGYAVSLTKLRDQPAAKIPLKRINGGIYMRPWYYVEMATEEKKKGIS